LELQHRLIGALVETMDSFPQSYIYKQQTNAVGIF
jgi:hypothetical protein